jgi:hypothetical protein
MRPVTIEATWSSGDLMVATFNEGESVNIGEAYAKGVGTTQITATLAGITSTPAIITVEQRVCGEEECCDPCCFEQCEIGGPG